MEHYAQRVTFVSLHHSVSARTQTTDRSLKITYHPMASTLLLVGSLALLALLSGSVGVACDGTLSTGGEPIGPHVLTTLLLGVCQ
jgi:hypothetical protein